MTKPSENLSLWAEAISLRLEETTVLKPPNKMISYIMAIILSLLALGVEMQLGIGHEYPFLLFLLAVMLAAFYGGFRAGILATVFSTALVNIFLFPPYGMIQFSKGHIVPQLIFFFEGILIAFVIAGQKRIWNEVYKQREWFLVTLESIGDAVIATDTKGNIMYMNEVAEEATGWDLDEVKGKKLHKVFHVINEQSRDPIVNSVARVLQSGKITALANHTLLIKKNKKEIPIDDSASPIKDKNGRIVGVIMVFRDITQKKKTETTAQFMIQASEILGSSLDYQKTLKSIAGIAVPHIADWCTVHLLDEAGDVAEVALSHIDPKKIRLAKKLQKHYPTDSQAKTGVPNVIRTGKPELYMEITNDMLEKVARDKEHFRILKKIGIRSGMMVPIIVGGRGIGAITFITAESQKYYDETDLVMAQELASRAGLAIENARLYTSAQEERKRLKALVSNVPGVVWESWGEPDEKSQQIDFVSDYVETMLGYSIKEWLSTPNFWLTIVHPDDKEKAAEEARKIYRSGKIGANRFRWIAKDGRVLWVETQSYMFTDKRGKPAGMRGVTMDITRQVELEQRKDEFIGMASHELKTPVTSLKVYAQYLEKQFEKHGILQDYPSVSKMNTQIDKLTQLISDLLNLSKIQAGKLEFRKELFDINTLIEETVESIQATDKSHTIEMKGSVNKKVYGDRDRIEQVLINLLTNAIKYSPNSDKIIVSVSSNDSRFSVSVTDFGIGIPKEFQPRIFDRFYQVYSSDRRPVSGLGIGLYISNEIIQRHAGRLTVESKEGKGSTFRFTLPLKNDLK